MPAKKNNKKNDDKKLDKSVKNKQTRKIKQTGGDISEHDTDDALSDSELEEEYDEHFEELDEDELLDDNKNEIDDEDVELETDEDNETDIDEKSVENYDNIPDDECVYKNIRKKTKYIDYEEDDEEQYYEEDDEDENIEIQEGKYVNDDEKLTTFKLTKYERARVLGERTEQLRLGAKPMIADIEVMDAKDIAKKELELGVMPYNIVRQRPDGKYEKMSVNSLKNYN